MMKVDAGPEGAGEIGRPLRVMKFGGTSLGSAERMLRVVDLVAAALREYRVVVVASAVAGVTDLLENGIAQAVAGDAEATVRRFSAVHDEIADGLAAHLGREGYATLRAALAGQRAELERLLRGIALLRDVSPRVRARTVTLGERAACAALGAALAARGLPCVTLDPRQMLPCTGNPLEATPLPAEIRRRLQPLGDAATPLALLPGFYGGNAEGEIVCLGRGGSDYTAALAAAALDAERLEIWTDVDGIFTADPRAVPGARPLAEMSFEEAMELAYFGAKVLHPKTIAPVRSAGIPVQIANSLRPAAPGTWVGRRSMPREGAVRGLSYLRDVALLDLSGPGMPGVPGIAARAFGALARHGISLILITQGSAECAISFCVRRPDADPAVVALRVEFEAELESARVDEIVVRQDLVVLSAVGDGMRHRVGIAGAFFDALAAAGANVMAIAQGSSERSISAVLEEAAGPGALRAVHRRFFEPDAARPALPVSEAASQPSGRIS